LGIFVASDYETVLQVIFEGLALLFVGSAEHVAGLAPILGLCCCPINIILIWYQ
jgi:hypothetical protein